MHQSPHKLVPGQRERRPRASDLEEGEGRWRRGPAKPRKFSMREDAQREQRAGRPQRD